MRRRRQEVSQAIQTMVNGVNVSGAAPPRMIWDERVAINNLSDPTGDAVANSRITPEDRRAIERYALAHRALLVLTEREHEVVSRHYGFATGIPMPLTEVAGELGMSYNATQKAHGRAIRAMRKAIKAKTVRQQERSWWTGSEGYGW